MIPKPAQYLLRFDDLCPTVCKERWQRFLPLLDEFQIRPILAVVPDNQDSELQLSCPDPEFWEQMRGLQSQGAAIALHGYGHLCHSRGRSLVPIHGSSEFAGVDGAAQRAWIHAGLEILRAYGLDPRLWVAPRHGFDGNTLQALRAEGISVLSDGFARLPFTRAGLTWIPQQLWAPVTKSRGLWTICLHPNTAEDAAVAELYGFLREHALQFTSVDRVLAEFPPAPLDLAEQAYERLAMGRRQFAHFKKRALRQAIDRGRRLRDI